MASTSAATAVAAGSEPDDGQAREGRSGQSRRLQLPQRLQARPGKTPGRRIRNLARAHRSAPSARRRFEASTPFRRNSTLMGSIRDDWPLSARAHSNARRSERSLSVRSLIAPTTSRPNGIDIPDVAGAVGSAARLGGLGRLSCVRGQTAYHHFVSRTAPSARLPEEFRRKQQQPRRHRYPREASAGSAIPTASLVSARERRRQRPAVSRHPALITAARRGPQAR